MQPILDFHQQERAFIRLIIPHALDYLGRRRWFLSLTRGVLNDWGNPTPWLALGEAMQGAGFTCTLSWANLANDQVGPVLHRLVVYSIRREAANLQQQLAAVQAEPTIAEAFQGRLLGLLNIVLRHWKDNHRPQERARIEEASQASGLPMEKLRDAQRLAERSGWLPEELLVGALGGYYSDAIDEEREEPTYTLRSGNALAMLFGAVEGMSQQDEIEALADLTRGGLVAEALGKDYGPLPVDRPGWFRLAERLGDGYTLAFAEEKIGCLDLLAILDERRQAEVGQELPEEMKPQAISPVTPFVPLHTWDAILAALNEPLDKTELKNVEPTRALIRNLNDQHNGPIKFPTGKGKQPSVDKFALMEWWSGLREHYDARIEEEEAESASVHLSVADSHGYGATGKVIPGISGSEKRRRQTGRGEKGLERER